MACVEINQDFYIMQTIYRTAHTSNFTILSNELINSAMPPAAYRVLTYLLSKPKDWQTKAHDIRKQLNLSAYAAKKALRWLCSAGYAAWVRLKSGHTIWRIFSNPQAAQETGYSPAIPPQVEIPQVAFQPVLKRTETAIILKQQPTVAPIAAAEPVVVFDNLIYPEQIKPEQKKACKSIIKKAPVDMQQAILAALAHALLSNGNNINSVPGYLRGLVTAANAGTFTPVDVTGGTKPDTRRIDATQERLEAYRAVNRTNPNKAAGFLAGLKAAVRGE